MGLNERVSNLGQLLKLEYFKLCCDGKVVGVWDDKGEPFKLKGFYGDSRGSDIVTQARTTLCEGGNIKSVRFAVSRNDNNEFLGMVVFRKV